MIFFIAICFVLIFLPSNGKAQQNDSSAYVVNVSRQEVSTTRFLIVGGSLIATMSGIHIYQQNGWWKNNRAPFHFQEDLNYGLWVDKIGHFYGGYLLAFVMSKSLVWANVPEEKAIWYGSGGSLLFQTFVEMEDGFSKWGFDRVDWAFDLAGVLWYPARYHLPFLQNIDIKFSYHPSELLGSSKGIGFRGQHHIMIDDYEGQTFWMSVKVKKILPNKLKDYWPSFLCLSFGYGARDVAEYKPMRVFYIAPDIDMTEIIPQKTSFLKTLGEVLNCIHFPMPTVQFSRRTIFYGIYF